jgi:PKD repeat protein
LLSNNSAEKLAGVQASNGTDFWVSIHENSSATFLSYYVDATGVNTTAVSSTVGNSLVGNIGQLQFSSDGTRAAMASYSSINSETIEVFDFDAATGIFSNQIGLPTSYFQTYGLEFSPSGKLLYTGADPDVPEIHQWNLDAGSVADIIASNTVVGTTLGTNGSLQLATDGKIYMAFENSNYLGVVNNPDSLGLVCNWDATGVDLSPKTVGLGLPDFLASYFPSNPVNPVNFSVDQPEVCQKFCVNFTDASAVAGVSWLWNFEGGSPPTSTVQDPQNVCYNLPGTYDVTLIVTEANGNSDTLTSPDYITVFATPPFPTITQNGYTLTSSLAATYQWKLNLDDIPGATNQSYDVLQTGYYTVFVTDSNGCSNSANLYVQIVGIDEVNGFNFSSFPNPSSGLLNITWPNDLPDDELKLDVFNALGQLISSSEGKFSTTNNFELNLSDRAPGVYLIQLRTNEFVASKKINLIH